MYFLILTTKATLKWTKISVGGTAPPPRHKHSGTMIQLLPEANPTSISTWIFGGMDAPPSSYNDVHLLNLTCVPPSEKSAPKNASLPASNVVAAPNAEIARLQANIDYLYGKNMERMSLDDLEELERIYFEGLSRISSIKKQKIVHEMQQRYNEKVNEVESLRNLLVEKRGSTQSGMDVVLTREEELQSNITNLQSENLKLKKKLKELVPEEMEGIQKNNGVAFGTVSVVEFLPAQGQGIPHEGAASLGMGMKPVHQFSQPLSTFEKKRESEKKGVNRIPEDTRIQILKSEGISDESILEEAKDMQQLRWNRWQSAASPTYDNPFPESQREVYKKML
eukprot:TRINITY_DN11239_c0_g1_i2.p1 TRINITY_DN11239_c0_g1~~TRINITY_DN11239_c0_g1_i2.p1  ORF type:complete len:337 (+),score=91.44 TRINITY_DN11239_c0_g1_i2:43-1053(+)